MVNIKIKKSSVIRLNLEFYSLTEFANKLKQKGYLAFFPFKDKGIDIIGYNEKKNKLKS